MEYNELIERQKVVIDEVIGAKAAIKLMREIAESYKKLFILGFISNEDPDLLVPDDMSVSLVRKVKWKLYEKIGADSRSFSDLVPGDLAREFSRSLPSGSSEYREEDLDSIINDIAIKINKYYETKKRI